jgi:hypothetical protein
MRNELYADSRDELKWTIATTNATNHSQSIRWVAMLREDVNKHGKGTEVVPNASPVVTQFFQLERAAFQAGSVRHLSRIVPLCNQLNISIEINLDPYPSSVNRRLSYIRNEVAYLQNRNPTRRDFVLIDPDNGIGRTKSNGMQLHESHVPLVWNALRTEDTFCVVQFQHREVNWIDQSRAKLADLIDVQIKRVHSHHWDNICLFTVNR